MKNILFASAAAAALFAAAPVLAQSVGSVGAAYNHSEVEIAGVDGEADTWTVDGAVAFQAADAWTVTLDGVLAYDDDAIDDEFGVAGTVHLTRDIGEARVGGFAGLAEVADETAWAVGFEGEKYLSNVTLAGQVAYGQVEDADLDLWSVSGEARYFVSNNFRLDGGVSFANIDTGIGDDDVWTLGVGGEYQFASTPWSVTAGYEHAEFDQFDASADTFNIGLRYSFGGDLRARDRAGAELGGVERVFSAF